MDGAYPKPVRERVSDPVSRLREGVRWFASGLDRCPPKVEATRSNRVGRAITPSGRSVARARTSRPVMHSPRPSSEFLTPFVAALWDTKSRDVSDRQMLLPDGRMQLLVDLSGSGLRDFDLDGSPRNHIASGLALQGPRTRPILIDGSSQRMACGVSFLPGGAAPFFSVPAFEMIDRLVDLRDIWGQRVVRLVERLADAGTVEGRIQNS